MWYRISQVFPASSGYSLFGTDGACTLDDIKQGTVGNCWFMAAAAAIAEKPGRLEKNFGTNDQFNNNAGFFDVILYVLGCPVTVRVDDFLPFTALPSSTNRDNVLLSAKVTSKGVWMPVLEKALAKVYGNYSGLVSGTADEGISYLIGYPTVVESFTNLGQGVTITSYLQTALANDDIIASTTLSSISTTTPLTIEGTTLVAGHVYSVIGVDASGNIEVRNPWGTAGIEHITPTNFVNSFQNF